MLARFAVLSVALASPFCGSADDDAPDLLGTFTVESTLASNTCGQGGYPVPSVTELDATVRGYPGENAIFKWSNQSGAASGFATNSGVYSFESSSTSTAIEPEPSILYPGCQLRENVAMTFTVTPTPARPDADGGVDETNYAFTGRVTIDVSPVSGGDCTPLLGANGGTWNAIPCQVVINLAGSRKD